MHVPHGHDSNEHGQAAAAGDGETLRTDNESLATAGWVCLHRRLMQSPVFTCPQLLKAWLWVLLKASHCDRWTYMKTGRGGTQLEVKAGQFIYGRKVAAQELNMPESSVNERMQKLQRLGCISIQPGTHYSIVSICNWSSYQDANGRVGRQLDNQPTTNRQPTNNQPTQTTI